MKANTWEFQHALVIADIDKRKIKKDKFAERCEDQEVIQENIIELVDVGALNLW